MYKIEKNIPAPAMMSSARGRLKSKLRITVEKMRIGDSLLLNGEDVSRVENMAWSIRRVKPNFSVVRRKVNADQYRVWRIK